MKKIILAAGLLAFISAASAQEPEKMPPAMEKSEVKVIPGQSVEMREGKVWLTKDGKTTLLNGTIKIGGSKVSSDGVVELSDGTRAKLKNGDRISADGKLIKAPIDKMPQEEQYKTPDN